MLAAVGASTEHRRRFWSCNVAEQLAELRWRRTPDEDRAEVKLAPGFVAFRSTFPPDSNEGDTNEGDTQKEIIEVEVKATVRRYLDSWVLVRTPEGDEYWVAKAMAMPSLISKAFKSFGRTQQSQKAQQSRSSRPQRASQASEFQNRQEGSEAGVELATL